jgi:Asp/Glu/hydantoin racemase
VGAVVLECANMPPCAARLRARIGLPVYDMVDLGRWLYAGLAGARSRT